MIIVIIGVGSGVVDRLVGSLDHRVEAINVVCGVGYCSNGTVGLGETIAAGDNAVFESLLHILNIASLDR